VLRQFYFVNYIDSASFLKEINI